MMCFRDKPVSELPHVVAACLAISRLNRWRANKLLNEFGTGAKEGAVIAMACLGQMDFRDWEPTLLFMGQVSFCAQFFGFGCCRLFLSRCLLAIWSHPPKHNLT